KREAEQAKLVVRRTLVGLAAALLLAIIAGIVGFYAWQQQRLATAERDRARSALAQILAERSWSALSSGDRSLAIRYSLSGWRVAPANARHYRAPLAQALTTSMTPSIENKLHQGALTTLVASPDGKLGLSGGSDGNAILFELGSGHKLSSLTDTGKSITAAAF